MTPASAAPPQSTPPARQEPKGAGRLTMLLFIGGAAPIAFVFELALRTLLFPPEFELLRAELRPTSTSVAWVLLALCVPSVPLGMLAKRALVRSELAKLREPSAQRRARVELEALLLATSIPQLPALLATLTFMFGSALLPVLITLAVSTLGVVAMGVGRRSA